MSTSNSKKKAKVAGSRLDPGWAHAIEIDAKEKKVQCMYCQAIRSGGIYRLKHHLAGTGQNAEPCPQVSEDIRRQFITILQNQAEEAEKKKRGIGMVDINQAQGPTTQEPTNGKIDSFVKKSTQSTINLIYKKDLREKACEQISRFFYTSAIPFNCANNPEFAKMLELVAKHGPGFKPPSYHEIREKYLKKEVANTMTMIGEYTEEWKKTGCTIMSDAWTDRKRRSICNFMVNSPKGTVFLTSIDTSDISKTADKVFEMLDGVIEIVGEDNVVQVVTDNASNYKLAGEKLMEKRKKLFWTPCSAHCIDLMLEDFEKQLEVHRLTIASGRRITTFIYGRTMLITWLREATNGKDLIRPATTRFATAYLTLGCLSENKGALMSLFASDKWKSSRFAKLVEGKKVESTVLDSRGFWADVTTCLKAALPLISVLRLADSDVPAMGFIYEKMERAKEKIQLNYNNVKKSYEPVWNIIEKRWETQLNRPLHYAAYFLNPHFHYSPSFKCDYEIKMGLYKCIERMIPNSQERVTINLQIDDFTNARGLFGIEMAKLTRDKKCPADWWDSFGDQCPELKRFAIRILSLTCSSSGCERNWSAFEMVHSKRRNRLHQKKMNDLVFVMYNVKLQDRKSKREAEMKSRIVNFEDIDSDDEWITEKEVHGLSSKLKQLNILNRASQGVVDAESDSEEDGSQNSRRNLKRSGGNDHASTSMATNSNNQGGFDLNMEDIPNIAAADDFGADEDLDRIEDSVIDNYY